MLGLTPETVPEQYSDVTARGLSPAGSPLPGTCRGNIQGSISLVRHDLEPMQKEELLDLLETLMDRFPEVQQEIADRRSVAEADPYPLYEALLDDIEVISEEEAWSDDWSGNAQIPDYSPVRKRMEMLLAMDQADMVIDAGKVC